MKKIAILSRYQGSVNRGVESVVYELQQRLSNKIDIDVFNGSKSDDLGLIIKGNYDYVMPTNGRMQSFKMSYGRLLKKYKLVIGGHSGIGRDEIWNIAVCKPDIFIALTDYMAGWAKKWAWGSRVVKISNGVDLRKFNSIGGTVKTNLPKPIILSVGALTWYKHHERAIEAVSLCDKGSLLIVGTGEDKDKLMRLGKQKLPGRFGIMDVSYSEMPSVYRIADLFTLPSWDREAFGVVYLEAMATNVPVVAPNDLSRREIVGDGGILVDVTDAEKYAESIKKALQKDWGNLPRKQSEKFSWDKVALDYEELFLGK